VPNQVSASGATFTGDVTVGGTSVLTESEAAAAYAPIGIDTTADDLSDNQIGDLGDVTESGADSGEALVSDGAGGWGPSAATVCLSDGTNCPAATAISQGDSHVTVTDAGTGSIVIDADGGTDEVTVTAGNLAVPNGSTSSPPISIGSFNIYSPATNKLGLLGGTNERARINTGSFAEFFGLCNNCNLSWYTGATTTQAGSYDVHLRRSGAAQLTLDADGSGAAATLVVTGGLIFGDPGTKPTCDASIRGKTHTDYGGAGVADTHEICLKDSGDSYAWVAIATP
jgi:hypothetical protein